MFLKITHPFLRTSQNMEARFVAGVLKVNNGGIFEPAHSMTTLRKTELFGLNYLTILDSLFAKLAFICSTLPILFSPLNP